MITDTMVPEAFTDAYLLVGLITVLGFLVAFALSHARPSARHRSATCRRPAAGTGLAAG
ncbi:hypothetical protein [Micromonospora sp. CNB394]|uniref:hypothetical protein n=1 Tax=Micromonospora sp. CNB394 TaxID=1169151 RepID=UPI00037078B8|nr:hypothetical protein [Micromonospora sp. CNB394]